MEIELTGVEQRVLGVLVEKGYTTPDQYPLTLNATVVGCNQKSCRDPMMDLDVEAVLDALDALRERKLVVKIRPSGSRTDRYRHCVPEQLEIDNRGAAVIAELLLRGPQTDGELRQRANRMIPIDNLAKLQEILAGLAARTPPLVRRLSPGEQRRGSRYAHTFYAPGEEPAEETASPASPAIVRTVAGPAKDEMEALRAEIDELKRRVAALEEASVPRPPAG